MKVFSLLQDLYEYIYKTKLFCCNEQAAHGPSRLSICVSLSFTFRSITPSSLLRNILPCTGGTSQDIAFYKRKIGLKCFFKNKAKLHTYNSHSMATIHFKTTAKLGCIFYVTSSLRLKRSKWQFHQLSDR